DRRQGWYLLRPRRQVEGKPIVPAELGKTSVAPLVSTGSGPGAAKYGLAWWLYPTARDPSHFYWSGSGFGGQFPAVMTDEDIVVVFNAWNILPGRGSMPARRMMDRIAAAVTDSPAKR